MNNVYRMIPIDNKQFYKLAKTSNTFNYFFEENNKDKIIYYAEFMFNDELIALISFIEYENTVEILTFEVSSKYRNKGHGTNIINVFKVYYMGYKIYGYSMPESISFWKKLSLNNNKDECKIIELNDLESNIVKYFRLQ